MLHRPADSRLLSNLLSHEKDYVRSFNSQLDYGQASLASFSAYAAASPPPASRTIGSVANALVGAQDALRGYVLAVEEWCEQLKMLKDMEDEVGTIARDREILVDRLIKASKANNPKRRSLLPSSTNNNFGSPTFSGSNHALDQLSFSNSKLNLAQSELQACETHLSEKERILAQMRESCLVGGLKMRCKALAECGFKWSELGRSGLQTLDASSSASKGSLDRSMLVTQKPLPDINYPYQRPSSDISSSIAPSQSASQIFHPDVLSEQYHPSVSSSSGHPTLTHAPPPEADIRDDSRFELRLPPAHAISEEDHYTPPQAYISTRPTGEDDDVGGSSLEEGSDERQYEVHDNPLFASHPLASKPGPKRGSKIHLPVKRHKPSVSDSSTILSAPASAPLPASDSPKIGTRQEQQQQTGDRFGSTSSGRAYSDGHQDSPRTRKRSTFLGLGVLTGIFHKRDRTASGSAEHPDALSSSPSKKEKWRTRTDKNLKKSGKHDDSSDDEVGPSSAPIQSPIVPSYLLPSTEAKSQPDSHVISAGKEANAVRPRPKRSPSAGRKLRKTSDSAAALRKSSEAPQSGETKKAGATVAKKDTRDPQSQIAANGHPVSALSSASVSRSSTVCSQSTIKTTSSTRHASLDLPRPSATIKPTGTLSDSGHKGAGKARRRPTSFSHVSTPPTNGQMSLLSIVEDVTRQNRQSWLQANPNNLLVEVKAPKSVLQSLALDGPASVASSQQTQSDLGARRRESPLRHQPVHDLRRNSLSASSSEPSLPLKNLPPTPTPAPKVPLRSALRNRSASPSPATVTPPRTSSPMQKAGAATTNGVVPAAVRPSAEHKDSAGSSVKDDDTASMASAYETGHEDFDSGPPTPSGQGEPLAGGPTKQLQAQRQQHTLPNGHVAEIKSQDSHVDETSTTGTATPPSRRKSVRVSLKPTFSPTPPAMNDYGEDRSPWAHGPPGKGKGEPENDGWISKKSAESVWEDSSDEDEEYSRAKEALKKASHKLERSLKVHKHR